MSTKPWGATLRSFLTAAWLGVWGLGLGLSTGTWAAESGAGRGQDPMRPDPYGAMHAQELRMVARLQRWEGMGRVMEGISHLGPGKPMLAMVGVLLCLVGPRLAGRVAVMLVLCLWARELLAMVLQSPRPYWFGDGVRTFRDTPLSTPTFGLPSGHATAAAAVWFFLAAEVRRRWAWVLAGVIVAAVGLSRVYLGLHFVSDVVLGSGLGALGAFVFRASEGKIVPGWMSLPRRRRLAVAAAIGMGIVLVSSGIQMAVTRWVPEGVWPPYGVTARISTGCAWSAGAIFGAALACVAPVGWASEGDTWRWRWARLGLAAVPAALYLARPDGWRWSALLPDQPEAVKWAVRFLTATFLGWAALFLLPRTFLRLGWVPASTGIKVSSPGPGEPADRE